MIKRVTLFLATNLAVILLLSLVTKLLGLDSRQMMPLLLISSVIGFGGSFISLMLSKTMAKWSTKATIILTPKTNDEQWILSTVSRLAETAKIGMPEVGIYSGPPNAFATGASRDSSLVCVSTGLMQTMTRDEVEAVLGHEIAHVANGDMVTMTLIQGVINTFVIFVSRLVASAVATLASGNRNDNRPGVASYGVYYMVSMVCELVFGLLASLIVNYYSRQREYRADAGSSYLLGGPKKMIGALRKLEQVQSGELPKSMAVLGISDRPSKIMSLLSTHPPLSDRVAALEETRYPATLK